MRSPRWTALNRVWDYLLGDTPAPKPRPRPLAFEALEAREVPATISGTVYAEVNGVSGFNSGDYGVPGDQLWLQKSTNKGFVTIATTTSGADGTYQFDGVDPSTTLNGLFLVELHDTTGASLYYITGTVISPGSPGTTGLNLPDGRPRVSVARIADATEGGSAGTFRFTRTGGTSAAQTVNVSVSGTAAAGTDYPAPTTVTFAAGSATADYTVAATNDSTSEPTETVVIAVAPGTGYAAGAPGATLSIFDNDAPVVSVAAVNDAVEGATGGTLRFTRIGALTGSRTVNYTVGGTATSGTDFTALSGTVTFAAGASTADVTVAALHDGLIDNDEDVSVTVTSGTGYSIGSPASASVTIVDTEFLPLASDGWEIASVNASVGVAVLDLVVDTNGDGLTVTAVTDGLNGSVVINLDGTVTYTPDTDFVGDDTFTYTVEDPFGNESTGTIFVTVVAPDAPPLVTWTALNTPVTVPVLNVASDLDGDTLTVDTVTQGSHGTVVINSGGTVTYTPNSLFSGDDVFTYTVEDEDGNQATNTVIVTVGPIPPVALDTTTAVAPNTAVVINVRNFAYQPGGGSVTTTAVTQGTHGTVVINPDGNVTYTPATNYTGTDTFTYTVANGGANNATATVTVTVGAPASTVGDAIVSALGGIEDLFANYATGSADDIADAVDDIVPDIEGYLDDMTTLVSVNSVGTLGSAKNYTAYQPAVWRGFMATLYPAYMVSLDTETLLWNILRTLTNKLDGLLDELNATTIPVVADALALEITTLRSVHNTLQNSFNKVREEVKANEYPAALKAWAVTTGQLPAIVRNAFQPPAPPVRDSADITYKPF